MRSFSLVLWLVSVPGTVSTLSAQNLSIGLVGGVSLTEDYASGTTINRLHLLNPPQELQRLDSSTSGAYAGLIGPKVELSLPWHLSLEVDALRRKYAVEVTTTFNPPAVRLDGSTVTVLPPRYDSKAIWEVPVIGKRNLPVLRRARPFVEGGVSIRPFNYVDGASRNGIVAGAGSQLDWRGFVVESTLRYTYHANRYARFFGTPNEHQVELFLGMSRGVGPAWEPGGAREVSTGILGGFGLLNDFANKDGHSGVRSKPVGAMFEFGLPGQWSLEVDTLYHPLVLSELAHATVLTWELPVLAKYKLTARRVRPVFEAGPNFRIAGNTNGTNPSHFGLTSGVGIEAKWRKLKISPVLRYTYRMPDGPAFNAGASTRNQLNVLLGLSY